MPFRRLDLRAGNEASADLEAIRDHLAAGGLIAYPTETVYGFGCALDEGALRRLSELKRRGASSPFLLLVPEGDVVGRLRWPRYARRLAGAFWPGALTLVLSDPDLRFPEAVRGERGGVAIRRSAHPLASAIVDLLGAPVTSTSANAPGEPPARTARDAAAAARRTGAGKEMWILDGGTLPESLPSTIVDCTGERPEVLRAGAIPAERISSVGTGEEWKGTS